MSTRTALGLALVLALAFGARWLTQSQAATSPDTFAPVVDSEAYLLQALRVADGQDIVDGVYFQAPLYPWVLGLTLRLAGVPGAQGVERASELDPEHLAQALTVGRWLNVVLGLGLVLLLGHLGARLFDPAVGVAVAALTAVYGPFLFYEAHLLKVSLSLLFLPWAVLAAARAERRSAAGAHVWTGLALGLGGLVRGNLHLLALAAVLAVALAGWRRRGPGAALRGGLAVAAGLALALAPVVVRNSVVAQRPVLSTAAGGTAFFLCNHAGNDTGLVEHTGLNRQIPRYELDDWRRAAEQELQRPLSPAQVSQYWMGRALADIRADPGRWLWVELRKLGLLFSRYEAPDNTQFAFGEESCPVLAATPARYGVVLPLALGGAWLAWRQRRRQPTGRGWLALAALGYGGSLLLFNVTSRFRLPLAPLLLVYAGLLLAHLPDLWRGGARLRLQVGLAVLLGWGLSLVSESGLGPLDAVEKASHRVVRLKNRAQVALSRGDHEAARRDLVEALREGQTVGKAAPDVFVLLGALARLEALELEAAGDPAGAAQRGTAVTAIQQALELSPGHAAAQRMAGLLLVDEGSHADAVPRFRAALAAVPDDREAAVALTLALLETGQPDQAADEARQLLDRQPTDETAHGLLALALARLGRHDEARAALAEHDRLANRRRAAGRPPRLPELVDLTGLRGNP